MVNLSEKAQKVLELLPQKGQGLLTKADIMEKAGLFEEDYAQVKAELLEQGLVEGQRGRTGGLGRKLAEVEIQKEEAIIEDVEKAKTRLIQEEQRAEEKAQKLEKKLYPVVERWIYRDIGSRTVIRTAERKPKALGKWEIPDFLCIDSALFNELVGHNLTLTAVEVKLDLTIVAVLQAFAHARFSHYSWLVVHGKRPELYDTKEDLIRYAFELGVGLAHVHKIGAGEGQTVDQIHPSRRFAPDDRLVDRALVELVRERERPRLKREVLQQITP